MITNRMHFLSLIFTFSSCFLTTTNLHTWQTSYIDHMSPQELQITANLVYLLYANSIIEEKIRQFFTPIARLNRAIRVNINIYKNPAEDLATLKTLIERLSFVTSTRTIYNQTLSTCITHYNQNTVQMIDDALEALQLDAQIKLRSWADKQADETALQLKKSSDVFNDSIQHLQGVSRLHKGMSEGKMPVEIPAEDAESKSLIALSIILENNPELFTVIENVTNSLNETSDHVAQIIHAGAEIYKEYYMILYNKLMSPSFDKRYTTTLFSMYGMLPDEYKSTLPSPDHVFEHMLQTTKLYTQTEVSQP
ncbi:MAG TPA: hypothetical protein VJJ26_04445 [Candidatus Babeliales bacterium]|nr:hypothetical protein [Candidatus Babeliales bacterium]